ncbi:uncharacterized protein LOC142174500 [Nicotiana tabacum]|uniref:Uncharacterized protein LOC142174500 n=1 Tax=Nicotiana tabacum TaxID=4097 RepID=A0AC58TGS9_TOBAC
MDKAKSATKGRKKTMKDPVKESSIVSVTGEQTRRTFTKSNNLQWMDEEEKFGGLPVSLNEIDDFRHCINTYNLSDLGFKGSIFIWWNGRADEECIFKRLDRCLDNTEFQQIFPGLEVTHLSKIGSDHCPLLLKCDIKAAPVRKTFIFLNFWIKHESVKEVVKENCIIGVEQATYGDIFQKIASLEEVVLVHEAQFEVVPSQDNRERLQKVQADMIKYVAIEEEFWKQKSGMQWFKDGDRNTKFFHVHVNGRRKRLQLKRIQDSTGIWLEQEEEIAKEAVKSFKDQFTKNTIPLDFRILDHIPTLIDGEQNAELLKQPNKEEVKQAVFGLNGESA